MDREKIIENAKDYVRQLFRGNSGGHDTAHTMRVYANAMLIAEKERAGDRFTISLGALLHDVDDYKLFNTVDNRNARDFLKANGMDRKEADAICQVINEVSFSRNRDRRPSSIEAMIVQDADRL
ncbi:MAG: HD domain-containing protein, partial [Spirochaetales bacterium]|nr:HD domain-containing protein [Spirochaetales bacterium]